MEEIRSDFPEEELIEEETSEEELPESDEPVKSQLQIVKEGWYDKVDLTVKQLDIIIGCGIVGLILTFIAIALDAMNII